MSRRLLSTVLLIAVALGCAAGCESKPSRARYDAAFAVPGRPRSMAFDSPRLRQAQAAAPADEYLPWYLVRADGRLSTEAGYTAPQTQEAYGYTYDRQSQSSGRVYDYYANTTYRRFSTGAVKP